MLEFASALLISTEGNLILQLRDDVPGIRQPGKISFFGGEIEEGETPREALARELYEEINLVLDPDVLEEHDTFTFYPPVVTEEEGITIHVFVARDIDAGRLTLKEGAEIVYVDPRDNLSDYDIAEAARRVLLDFLEH